ncbi:MAG: hypothetical protein HY873_13210 [Chloroflexi bacterium]|nr:hypothetical protein [Chloroflexota bacterium]
MTVEGVLPVVTTPREWGAKGHAVTLARYGKRRMDAWARSGGRKHNPTLAEIEAAERAEKAEKARARAERQAAAAISPGEARTTGRVRPRRPVVGSAYPIATVSEAAGASNHGPVRASSTTGGGDSATTVDTRFA